MKVRAPIANPKLPEGHEFADLEMIEPHTLIAYMWNEIGMNIPEESVKAFWNHHRAVNSPWMENFSSVSDLHIPLGLYGDGARARQLAFQPVEKVLGIFISLPLFRPKSTRNSRWCIFSINENLLYGRKTLNAIFRRIVWSLNHLFTGLWPSHGPDNEPLNSPRAGQKFTDAGHRWALCELRGDWVYQKQVLGFNSSWTAGVNKSVCFRCKALGRGDCRTQYYHVHGDNAHSFGREYNLVSFLLNEMPANDICT